MPAALAGAYTPGMFSRVWKYVTSELVLLIMAAAIVLGAWGFSEIADGVQDGDSQTFDERIMRALRTGDDYRDMWGPVWLEQSAMDITALGGVTVLTMLTIAAAVYLVLTRRFLWSAHMAAAMIGGTVATSVLKNWFARPRPDVVPHLTTVHTMSFPSGHAAMSAAAYLTLGVLLAQSTKHRGLRIFFMSLALLLTLAVGCSRILLGVHYPTDVLAGWCLGLGWAALVWLVGHAIIRWYPREDPARVPADA